MHVHCLFPRGVFNKYLGTIVSVPCGHCSVCMTERSNRWKTRLEIECTHHRYSLFFTLTYCDECLPTLDPSLVVSDSPTWSKSLADSCDYIKLCHNKVPVATVSDFSSFIKRVRSRLKYLYPDLKNGFLRYFVTSEYGPTTFRPHFHGFLWFDDPRVYKSIKEVVYKSWPSSVAHPTISSFFQRNKFKFVGREACQYVAGYINSRTNLPALLYEKPFRTSHVQSISAPVGCFSLSEEQIQGFVSGEFDKITLARPSDKKQFSVSLWPSIESRLFPRCAGFHRFTSATASRFYVEFVKTFLIKDVDFRSFIAKLFKVWEAPDWLVREIQKSVVRCQEQLYSVSLSFDKSLQSALYRLFLCMRRFQRNLFEIANYTEKTVFDYYQRKNYRCLVAQIEDEEAILSRNVSDNGLCYLPYLIDDIFINNQRCLPLRTIESYEKQFNVKEHPFTLCRSSFDYLKKRDLCNRIVSHSTKIRRKKDYLTHHPEYENLYINNLIL